MTAVIFIIALVLLAAHDIEFRRLPNVAMFPLIGFAVFLSSAPVHALTGAFLGFICYMDKPLHQQIGEADVKLSMLLGAMFGLIGIVGMIGGILLVAVIRYLTKERKALAFTPFAALSTFICLLSDKVIGAIVR